MRRTTILLAIPSVLGIAAILIADDAREKRDRVIAKEPDYQSAPKYALLAFGADAKERVWIVEDGKSLYVDRNANGDLTDDGSPIELSPSRTGTDYVVPQVGSSSGGLHTDFRLRRWNQGQGENYGLSINVGGTTPMYAGWNSFLSTEAKTAPVIHFGASMRPRILRYKQFVLGTKPTRLSFAFITEGQGEGAQSRLSIDAVPTTIVPTVEIDWPVVKGAEPLQTTHKLSERCCYWEFYTSRFEVPEGAVEGTATVTIKLPAGTFLDLSTDQLQVPVKPKGTPFEVK